MLLFDQKPGDKGCTVGQPAVGAMAVRASTSGAIDGKPNGLAKAVSVNSGGFHAQSVSSKTTLSMHHSRFHAGTMFSVPLWGKSQAYAQLPMVSNLPNDSDDHRRGISLWLATLPCKVAVFRP